MAPPFRPPERVPAGPQQARRLIHRHCLDQLSDAAYYAKAKGDTAAPAAVNDASVPALAPPEGNRKRLHVAISLRSVKRIDPIDDTFVANLRIEALWEEEDLAAVGLGHLAAKARTFDEYVCLTDAEISECELAWGLRIDQIVTVRCILSLLDVVWGSPP